MKQNNNQNGEEQMNLNEVAIKAIEEAERRGLGSFGLRAEYNSVTVGKELDCSSVWIDGGETGEKLEGTSALMIDYDGFDVENIESVVAELCQYEGSNIILIGGTDSYEGNDLNETVISSAEVLAIF